MTETVIAVTGLGKSYSKSPGFSLFPMFARKERKGVFWALRDLDFEIARGESIGIIGPNGAGKSTLLKILAGIVSPTEGEARIEGRVNSLLEVGTGFQPDLSGRANIYLNASILGLSKRAVDAVFDEIVAFSGVGEFIDMPVRHYSSGMYSRLAFAVAAHVTGDILLVDEVLSVGDAEFRRKSLSKMNELMEAEHRTVLFVSHSMDAVLRICDRVLWLQKGRIEALGPADEVVREYLNRTSGLGPLSAVGGNGVAAKTPADASAAPAPEAASSPAASKGADVPAKSPPSLLAVSEGAGESETQHATIFEVGLYGEDGALSFAFFRDERIRVEWRFRVDVPERFAGFVAVRCSPRKGVPEETVVFTDYSPSRAYDVGQYAMAVTLPERLFTTAAYVVTVALMSVGKPLVKHHMLKRVLSFQVADRDGESEMMGEHVRGVIRPRLSWDVSAL